MLEQDPKKDGFQNKESKEQSLTKKQSTADKTTSENEKTKEVDAEEKEVQKETTTQKDKAQAEKQKSKEAQENEDIISPDENEEEQDEVEDEYYGIPVLDYDEMNLDALGEELERLLKDHKVKEIREHVRRIKMEFDAKFDQEREDKKEEFLENGGNIIDFSYSTPAERKFHKLYFEYKEKRDKYYKDVRKNLKENLERRLKIIEELKAITGVGTDMNANFSAFKKLQVRWRKAGPVPRADYKDTWNTYHYHVERFYDFLHLDREFRELDYKHNLKQKLKMIQRAEELIEEENVNRAFRELQNLHRMWKEEVGPVAKEYSEEIWEKFSTATKKIHENRKTYYAELDKKREKNLVVKKEIIDKIEKLTKEKINSHHQAQNLIKKFKNLRDRFFNAGRVPKKDNNETWEAFKKASYEFNHKKNEFYKNRKNQQNKNLEQKLELIEIAEKYQDSDDWEKVTPIMKKIQADWKKIGYVKRSKSDKIWKRFKNACNHYFNRLHAKQDEKEKEALAVFADKQKLLEETEKLELSGDRKEDLPAIKTQIEKWKKLGRVPRNKQFIEKKFNKTLDKLFNQLDMDRKESEMLKYENRLQNLEQTDDDYKIRKEASFLRKKIDQTSNEIRQLETNLQFFDNADKSNPLMKSTFDKIDKLKQQLNIWEAKYDKLKQL